jgi:RNA polymerase sigma-70 factor (ECF subfamily)
VTELETSLLHRIAAKDRKAFEALYHRYDRRLFAFILKLTRRADMVEEILNDVLLAIWKGAGGYDGRSRPSTWIFGIAYHKAAKALARRRPEPTGEPEAEPVDFDEPESLLARRELRTVLGRALHALPAEQRAVVEMTYYYGLAYQEIATIMGCPVNTVKTRMFHARRRLREILPGMGISGRRGQESP